MLFDGILHRDKVENYIQKVIDSIDKPFLEKLAVFKNIENAIEGFSEQEIDDILNTQFLKYETSLKENQPRKEYTIKPKREIKPKRKSHLSDEEGDSKTTGENFSENTEESQEKIKRKSKKPSMAKPKGKKNNSFKEIVTEHHEIRDYEILNIVEEGDKLKILEQVNTFEEERDEDC